MKFGLDKLKAFGLTALTAGKKNAPTLMTAGSVILGWTAAYFFWKQGKKAEKKIEYEEERLNADLDSDTPLSELRHLPKKDKFIIYLQYCWMSLAMGIGSSALAIGANQLNLSRLAEMALLTQFMTNKDEDNKKLIEKLKKEVPKKKVREIENEQIHERVDSDKIVGILKEMMEENDDRTLFIDDVTGETLKSYNEPVKQGLSRANDYLLSRRKTEIDSVINMNLRQRHIDYETIEEKIDRVKKDPYGVLDDLSDIKDTKYADMLTDEEVKDLLYAGEDAVSSLDYSSFLYMLGFIKKNGPCNIGDLVELRCFTNKKLPIEDTILRYDYGPKSYAARFFNGNENVPEVCFVEGSAYVYPTSELAERDLM